MELKVGDLKTGDLVYITKHYLAYDYDTQELGTTGKIIEIEPKNLLLILLKYTSPIDKRACEFICYYPSKRVCFKISFWSGIPFARC